jgi:replicative DNA helicase
MPTEHAAPTHPNARLSPPFSLEAEQAVLGSLMLDKRAFDRIADLVITQDFYRNEHQQVFKAIEQLTARSQPVDCLTVAEQMQSNDTLKQSGGESYIYELANNTPAAGNVVAYANIVHERAILRELIAVAGDINHNATQPNGEDSLVILDKAEQLVHQISERRSRGTGPVDMSSLMARTENKLQALSEQDGVITGLSTGFTDLDNMTGGLQESDLIIIAGRPSMGKTAFSMNIAEYAALQSDQPVLVFSMEMPAESLAMRMISSWGRIEQQKIRTGQLKDEDWPRVRAAMGALAESKLYIDDTPALTPTELRARARRLSREHNGMGLIVIDYMQLMTTGTQMENRATEISTISRNLKALAKELNTPVIALSQLNRSLENRPDKRPVMSDLRESGAIEQDADVIAFVYRDEVYNEESAHKGTAEIIIGKQRNGPIGKVRLTFMGKYTRFDNHTQNPIADAAGGF